MSDDLNKYRKYWTKKWEGKYYQEGIGEITEEQYNKAKFEEWHLRHRDYLKQWIPKAD